jgi:uncharacterized membrane protein YdjX (TVP38/TMEM64 family)
MPFAATSYMLGLSTISLRDYTLGTLAALPALFGYVCVGSFARSGVTAGIQRAGALHWALLMTGVLTTVLLALVVGRIVARSGLLRRRSGHALPGLEPAAGRRSADEGRGSVCEAKR